MSRSILPRPQGPLMTGCADLMFGRTSEGSLLRIYYPTSLILKEEHSQHTEDWANWFLGNEYTKGLAQFVFPTMPTLFERMFNWHARTPKIPSYWEAPLAQGKFPLVIFSHGLSANRSIYSTICNEMASHGFFVASLEHRDESACATFTLSDKNEKEWIYFHTLAKNVKEYPLRSKQVKIRADECSRALDIFEKLNQGESLLNELSSSFDITSLQNCIDISKPIIAGHSFGGATVLLTLSKDKRFKCGISLDPWMFPLKDDLNEIKKCVTQPLLIILTETFQNQPNFEAYHQIDAATNIFITLKGSTHQNQSDIPYLFGFIGKALGGIQSKIDNHLAMTINNKLMINFISKHLELKNVQETKDLQLIAPHLQIGLNLQPATLKETDELLNFAVNNTKSEMLQTRESNSKL